MNRKQLLRRLLSGAVKNVRFADLVDLVEAFGFRLSRTSGSHRIYVHAQVAEMLNLQCVGSEAKPYQIRQFLRLVERYNLTMPE